MIPTISYYLPKSNINLPNGNICLDLYFDGWYSIDKLPKGSKNKKGVKGMDVVNVAYIQDLIEAHHYTLGQLEVKSGISKAQWSRILAYKRGVGTKTIAGVMRAFPEARIDQIFLSSSLPNGNKEKGEENQE